MHGGMVEEGKLKDKCDGKGKKKIEKKRWGRRREGEN